MFTWRQLLSIFKVIAILVLAAVLLGRSGFDFWHFFSEHVVATLLVVLAAVLVFKMPRGSNPALQGLFSTVWVVFFIAVFAIGLPYLYVQASGYIHDHYCTQSSAMSGLCKLLGIR
jgi:hypothetical protein